ncbi:MAG: VOC family protein [Jatrophihabitans sp.]
MHRSRIGVVLIDHPAEQYDAAMTFWAGAIGHPAKPDEDGTYASLDTLGASTSLELQRLGAGTSARVHLNIETDDVPAEIARVVALGAAIVQQRDGYAIRTDPGGLLFCVVPVQHPAAFDAHAVNWP